MGKGTNSKRAAGLSLFERETLKLALVGRYQAAIEEADNPGNSGRDRGTFATLAARLLKQIDAVAAEEREDAKDKQLAELVERLEQALARGPHATGGENGEHPFEAPEAPVPH